MFKNLVCLGGEVDFFVGQKAKAHKEYGLCLF